MAEEAGLELEAVSFAHGHTPVLSGVSLRVPAGSFFTLLGPSGGGKTTVLRLVGGYLTPASGRIRIGGRDVTDWPPERRQVGMVFQNYALFPHLTALENVAFGLAMRGVPRARRLAQADALLDRVGLGQAERGRRPPRLSGGQQQRVALARALVIEPAVLALDEPLANLDRPLREHLRGELQELQARTRVTTLLVTHDREEALQLSDTVAVLAAGRIHQSGPPQQLYRYPRTALVARLLGDANLLRVTACGPSGLTLEGGLPLSVACGAGDARPGLVVLLRPEECQLGPAGEKETGRVVAATYLGPERVVTVELAGGTRLRVRQPLTAAPVAVGEAVTVRVATGAGWVIPEADDGPC